MTHNYPTQDKSNREGIFCDECGTIFYVPESFAIEVRKQRCPFCGRLIDNGNTTTLRWINVAWQPDGDGF